MFVPFNLHMFPCSLGSLDNISFIYFSRYIKYLFYSVLLYWNKNKYVSQHKLNKIFRSKCTWLHWFSSNIYISLRRTVDSKNGTCALFAVIELFNWNLTRLGIINGRIPSLLKILMRNVIHQREKSIFKARNSLEINREK